MRAHIGMLTSVLVLLWSGNVWATIIEFPLDCAGTYDRDNSIWETDFDFGVEFTDISHVYIDWEGKITAGNAVFFSEPENPFPEDVGITSVLGKYPSHRHTTIWGGSSTSPNPESFDIISEFTKGPMPLNELFDGKGIILIHYNEAILIDRYYVDPGSIELNNAKLVLEGVLIPEPITFILLAIGTFGLRLRRN